jgi:nitroimidazol reductase NimA-like FMN-containing flavoprotein (pyridoxamine 5'-phosphate oxidase superfamily)
MIDMTLEEIDAFLDEQRIGRLCMAGADGRPYSLPFPFYWSGGHLYLRVGMTGRKGDILRENERVCFEVDHITDTLDDYASVLIEGRLVVVDDLTEKARIKQCNDEKYSRLRGGYRPGPGRSTPLEQLPLRKIVVECVTGRRKEEATSLRLDLSRTLR